MTSYRSKKRDIKDLQRLLLSLDLLAYSDGATDGVWDDATQAAVVRLYQHLGWKHDSGDRWVTMPALAAITSALHHHRLGDADDHRATGPGTGGAGSHTGGAGSHTGGGATPD
ncbi:MAG TPA: hypothetical protein VIS05_06365 [Ilumatobacter sp.]